MWQPCRTSDMNAASTPYRPPAGESASPLARAPFCRRRMNFC
jgi:hypothetical protein